MPRLGRLHGSVKNNSGSFSCHPWGASAELRRPWRQPVGAAQIGQASALAAIKPVPRAIDPVEGVAPSREKDPVADLDTAKLIAQTLQGPIVGAGGHFVAQVVPRGRMSVKARQD